MRHGRILSLLRRFGRDERGIVTTFLAFLMPGLIGVVSVAEYAHLHAVRSHLQATADAAALAALRHLSTPEEAVATAGHYGSVNMPVDRHGTVVPPENVTLGHWNVATNTFTVGGPVDAVRVIAERSPANGNPVPVSFLALLQGGVPRVAAEAIAFLAADDCVASGMVARGMVYLNSHARIRSRICLFGVAGVDIASQVVIEGSSQVYGRGGVRIGSHNEFQPGSQIGMLDLSQLVAGSYNEGLAEALTEADRTTAAGIDASAVLAAIRDGSFALPEYLDGSVSTVSKLPDTLAPGRLYIVNGNVSLEQFATYADVGILATGDIMVKNDATLGNVFLGADGNIDFAANVDMGQNFCSEKRGVFVVAGQDVDINAWGVVSGAQVLAGRDVRINAHVTMQAVSFLANRDLLISAQVDVSACADGASAAVVTASSSGRLVR